MGMNVGSGRTPGGPRVPTTVAEINVTPMVDVMLVLLIIFMVAAPMMQQGVQIDLPKANAGSLNDAPEQIVLVVNRSREIRVNNNLVPSGGLRVMLEEIAKVKPNVEVFIQGDQTVPYGFIAQVMAEVKKAKINRVGLVTEPADPNMKI